MIALHIFFSVKKKLLREPSSYFNLQFLSGFTFEKVVFPIITKQRVV